MTVFDEAERAVRHPDGPGAENAVGETPTPSPAPSFPVRASDAEREDTVARLHHALGEGRLDLAETEVRVAAAYVARYRSELPPLLAALPHSQRASQDAQSEAPAWSAIWASAVRRAGSRGWARQVPAGHVLLPGGVGSPLCSSCSRCCG